MSSSMNQKARQIHEEAHTMWAFDTSLVSLGTVFAGVDEVGRGCLAGPVYAAAVILGGKPEDWLGVRDSKRMSAKARTTLYDVIKLRSLACEIGIATVDEIEELNILHASRLAMGRALEALSIQVDVALVDGIYAPLFPLNTSISSIPIVDGDACSLSIAAASIVAKVERDRYMQKMGQVYPGYGFESNAGYGTREHLNALNSIGITPLHRRTFAPIRRSEQMRLNV